ncbi:hypothetical protein [Marinilactibacillus sp. Marseille-P9653]|uniref:hypothetical protein n=1 Tax=Marinilactibacillus sp. Marseille-P9653 TaxID=2866583 RepID=UPI001CE4B245|nr:hypothetical protein [Marinilactibacillus sp. Marseille-P9653]
MKILKKCLISLLTIIMMFQIFGTTGLYVYAAEIDSADSTTEDEMVNDTYEENTYEEDITDSDIENEQADVILSEYGISINGTYYTQEEFGDLLETAVEVEVDESDLQDFEKESVESEPGQMFTRAALAPGIKYTAVVAGKWAIAGVGAVVITQAGTIIVAGVAIGVGFWAYTKIRVYFTERAYNNHKKNGTKTNNHSSKRTKVGQRDNALPYTGSGLSSKDLLQDGKLKQRRYYDKNGKADLDIDYFHPGKHKFPHRHTFPGGNRTGH